MKHEDIPMGNRMIRILNRIISNYENPCGKDNLEYCKEIKTKLEKEINGK